MTPKHSILVTDLDHTIYNFNPIYKEIGNKVRVSFGLEAFDQKSFTDFDSRFSFLSNSYMFQMMFTEAGFENAAALSKIASHRFYKEFHQYEIKNPTKYLLPEALKTLKEMKKKTIPVIALTNLETFIAHKLLKVTGCEPYITHLIGYEEGQLMKPSPIPLQRALKMFRIPSDSKVLLVGDSDTDIICGQRASAITILFGRMPHEGINPDYVVENHKELINLIAKIHAS